MNENLNLVEILKDCPKGWKFWSPLFGEVEFDEISKICNYIYVKANIDGRWYFNADETITIGGMPSPTIMLYPSKNQQDWSKFAAPWAELHPVDVWHDVSEMPKEEEWILIQFDEDSYDALVFCDMNAVAFRTCCKKCGSIRWAYISDLLPKGGEQ